MARRSAIAPPRTITDKAIPVSIEAGFQDADSEEEDPETDVTIVEGMRATTPLRTVIDLAADLDHAHLDRIVADCLARGLFTREEARARLAKHDMLDRHGAQVLRHACSADGRRRTSSPVPRSTRNPL